jgi:hypothetical protein
VEVTFIVGVATGIVTVLVTRQPARKAKESLENWLAKKVQALAAKKLN